MSVGTQPPLVVSHLTLNKGQSSMQWPRKALEGPSSLCPYLISRFPGSLTFTPLVFLLILEPNKHMLCLTGFAPIFPSAWTRN